MRPTLTAVPLLPQQNRTNIGRLPTGRLKQFAIGAARTARFLQIGSMDFLEYGVGIHAARFNRPIDHIKQIGQFMDQRR